VLKAQVASAVGFSGQRAVAVESRGTRNAQGWLAGEDSKFSAPGAARWVLAGSV